MTTRTTDIAGLLVLHGEFSLQKLNAVDVELHAHRLRHEVQNEWIDLAGQVNRDWRVVVRPVVTLLRDEREVNARITIDPKTKRYLPHDGGRPVGHQQLEVRRRLEVDDRVVDVVLLAPRHRLHEQLHRLLHLPIARIQESESEKLEIKQQPLETHRAKYRSV